MAEPELVKVPTTAIINIGTLLTGDVSEPYGSADSLLIQEGLIAQIGNVGSAESERVIDAGGATVGPGLIDSHCHVVLGDYTPRQRTIGFLESYVHGGVTSCISPGEIHLPGRPHDAEGVKALAVLAQRSWANYRPNGMKVHGGAIILEPVLSADDFNEVASKGVWLAKFGFGLYDDPAEGLPQVRDAQNAGIKVMAHSGGASVPGSRPITVEHLLLLKPDVCGHVNGGPTSLDDEGLEVLVRETELVLQIVQAGNLRSSLRIIDTVREIGAERRVIIGSDTPTGTGVMPLGVLKTVAELTSLGNLDPGLVWAWASGAIADVYGLDAGKVEVGRPADLVISDAPWGSHGSGTLGALARGDIPGISSVLIDGEVRTLTSRNTPASATPVVVHPYLKDPCGSEHVC